MNIIPRPQVVVTGNEHFVLSYQVRIIIDAACGSEVYTHAKLLEKDIQLKLGYNLSITKGEADTNCIYLTQAAAMKSEEYKLTIDADGIRIYGGSSAGILYGIQTLRQVVAMEGAVLPYLSIEDYPDIPNRGYYFDVTRGRIPTLAYLKKLVEKLSYYKINQLQLYVEHSFLFKDLSEVWRDDTPLTGEDILELDAYCRQYHVELIPSLSSFGHLYKLLSSKTYASLCELEDSDKQPFSFDDRMDHHTVDVTNTGSIQLIKQLIEEYLPLFSSRYFNICADETFDLGKGRSKKLADQTGVNSMYIQYVRELCEYLVDKGKTPMFWGDIVKGFPEAIKELPEETICLNWGYSRCEGEESARVLAKAGAVQYLCPGVAGWNQFINFIDASYENISRMCSYAYKYRAIGVLNTDWGDFGHINHPEFSIAGIIFGAAFSWNHLIPDKDEIKAQISGLEFEDSSLSFIHNVAMLSENSVFDWLHAVRYMEMESKGKSEEEKEHFLTSVDFSDVKATNDTINQGILQLYRNLKHLDTTKRDQVKPYIVAAEGMVLFNTIGATLCKELYGVDSKAAENSKILAEQLEHWFYVYKEVWRTVSRESELYRIQNVILWYADKLREN